MLLTIGAQAQLTNGQGWEFRFVNATVNKQLVSEVNISKHEVLFFMKGDTLFINDSHGTDEIGKVLLYKRKGDTESVTYYYRVGTIDLTVSYDENGNCRFIVSYENKKIEFYN